jgi:hypothetical protein
LKNFKIFTCAWKLCINNLYIQFNKHLAYSLVVILGLGQTDGRTDMATTQNLFFQFVKNAWKITRSCIRH